MKLLTSIVLLISVTTLRVEAQQNSTPSLQFNRTFYELENQWVAFPLNPKTGKYPFGFIYIDPTAGFTLNVEGAFGLDPQGKVYRDSTDYVKGNITKIRLLATTKPLYAIPDNMLNSLGVEKVPQWLSLYRVDMNTTATKIAWGKHYNQAGATWKALEYLEPVYKSTPHAPGLEFEITFSYNEIKQYDKAIAILNDAIKYNPDNELFYKELAFSYRKKNDIESTISTYLKAVEILEHRNPLMRAEMAWNLALIYQSQNKPEEFKKWGQNAKDWAPQGSPLAIILSKLTFEKKEDNSIR